MADLLDTMTFTCRNIHTRVRTHAESIAFFGGGAREGQTVAAQYDSLMGHLRKVVNIRCGSACSQHDRAGRSPSALHLGLPRLGLHCNLHCLCC